MDLAFGKYRHYKGNLYEVVGIGKHSETDEEYVIYRPLYPCETEYFLRPLTMFLEKVTLPDGSRIPRFEYLG